MRRRGRGRAILLGGLSRVYVCALRGARLRAEATTAGGRFRRDGDDHDGPRRRDRSRRWRSRVSGDAGCARGVGGVVGGARGSGEGLHELEGTALGELMFPPALPIGNLRRLRRGDGDGVGLDVPVHVPGGEPHDGARQRDVERLVQSPRTAHAEVEARGAAMTWKTNNDA